jgi:hypothetical protein
MPKKKAKGKTGRSPVFYVSVHSMTIRRNKKNKTHDPPILVRRGKNGKSVATHRVDILDQNGTVVASIIYAPNNPLKCGAVVYVQSIQQPRIRDTVGGDGSLDACTLITGYR